VCRTPAGAGKRSRMRSMMPRSPSVPMEGEGSVLAGVFNSARLTDDGDFDLAGILELVLDAAGDVLRQPDGLLVRDAFAFDQDADLAAGLEGEGLGHALERIGNAF